MKSYNKLSIIILRLYNKYADDEYLLLVINIGDEMTMY